MVVVFFFCTVCPYVNCCCCFFLHCLSICKLLLLFFCTVWSTLIRISLTKALVLWWCDNKSDLIWFDLMILCPLTTRGHPLTTWTLAQHSLLHSTSDYNSHHPLHWRHTADCTEHTADYPDTHSWLHWSHSLLNPWTSSLSFPSFVERLASPRC